MTVFLDLYDVQILIVDCGLPHDQALWKKRSEQLTMLFNATLLLEASDPLGKVGWGGVGG